MEKGLRQYSHGLLDFHNHSTYSDGSDTPYQLVERAKRHGVTAMALTDHHTHKGLPEFRAACKDLDILGIPFGVEIGAELPLEILEQGDNETPDLIVLSKNPKEEPMRDYQIQYMDHVRNSWLPQSLDRLEKAGFTIPKVDLDEQCRSFHCPPEILYSFIRHQNNMDILINHVRTIDSSWSLQEIRQNSHKFLNKYFYAPGKPAYAKRVGKFSVDDAIELADAMNCKLFMAHPGGGFGSYREEVFDYYIKKGVHGIEVRNYFNNPEQNAKFDKLAKVHNLARSGGSDCHGNNGPFKIGMYDKPHNQLSKEILEELWDNLPN